MISLEDQYYYLKGLPDYMFRTPENPNSPQTIKTINEDFYLEQREGGCSIFDIIEKGKQKVTNK